MLGEELRERLLAGEDCFPDIIGQAETKKQVKSALLMDRHIIIVGAPGIGKTTLAKNVAKILPKLRVNDCGYNCTPKNPVCPRCLNGEKIDAKEISGTKRFVRVQGSPDLTSEDLIGDIDPVKALKYGPASLHAFTPGKIFKANNGVLFFDELNRCPEKVQNALLQVLEEKKATIGSYDVDLNSDFIFIGTLNPQDTSTEKLSDVFVDRFDTIGMNYPETLETESEIVKAKGKKLAEFPPELFRLAIGFVRHLRTSNKLEKLPSVRASIGLYERAQSNALLNNRKKVAFEDIRDVIVSVLSHRMELKPSAKYLINPSKFVEEEFQQFVDSYSEEKGGGL